MEGAVSRGILHSMQITSTEYPLFYVHCAREVTLTRVKQTDLKRLRSGYVYVARSGTVRQPLQPRVRESSIAGGGME